MIVDTTNDRSTKPRRENVLVDGTKHMGFRPCLFRLRNVKVHLITIEISIVWWTYSRIQAECSSVHQNNPVSHNGHSVQRRLTVEENNIIVSQLTVNSPSRFKLFSNSLTGELIQSDSSVIRPDGIIGTAWLCQRIPDRAFQHHCTDFLNIKRSDTNGHTHLICNGKRDAHLTNTHIGVR